MQIYVVFAGMYSGMLLPVGGAIITGLFVVLCSLILVLRAETGGCA